MDVQSVILVSQLKIPSDEVQTNGLLCNRYFHAEQINILAVLNSVESPMESRLEISIGVQSIFLLHCRTDIITGCT